MKKLLAVIFSIMVLGMLILSGCSAAAPSTTAAPPPWTQSATQPAWTQAAPTTQAPMTTTRPAPYNPPSTTSAAKPWGGPGQTVQPTIIVTVPPGAPNQIPSIKPPNAYPQATTPGPNSGNIGLSAGGAKDIANFRENIRNNYLPLPTDVTYEGLFYDYYFDTGANEPTDKLFSPSYTYAVTRDPLSQQTEYYLSVGLNSGMKENDFQRKKLNLVIVLDNSGSMGESYTQYYYDQWGKQIDAYADEPARMTKMSSATQSVVSILNQLNNDDRFAIVEFNSNAYLVKPMAAVRRTDMNSVKNTVLNINAGGSTNLAAGVDMANRELNGFYEVNNYEYENRIIVVTDAQPNTGDFTASGLFDMALRNADAHIYTTYVGIGVDFNSDLVGQITKIKGANYYSVHSPREFRQRVEEEFDYMVTPLVFNVQLYFESRGWKIEQVFGSPEADAATGNLMRINTLFPSKSVGGQNKGGLVLLKLSRISSYNNEAVYLKTSYEDRNGRTDGSTQVINLQSTQPEYFPNSGIRKGVLLVRYASLLQNWTIDERQHIQYSQPWNPCIREDTGIIIPVVANLSEWERQSLPLTVASPYRQIITDFSRYFSSEMNAIGDSSLGQEMDVLNRLLRY
jgi:Ca-activated chloride channel homolog